MYHYYRDELTTTLLHITLDLRQTGRGDGLGLLALRVHVQFPRGLDDEVGCGLALLPREAQLGRQALCHFG